MADDTIVKKLMELAEPILEKYCVFSQEAREVCIRNILLNGKILDLARSKYDLAAHLDQEAAVSLYASGAAVVQKKKRMNISVQVTPADRAAISAHNPDLQLEFDSTQRVNHSVAYVQRLIESKRCMNLLRHDRGHLTDVGGNPLYHAHAGHDNVHSCVLVDNARDVGRDVLRNLKADFDGVKDRLRYCVDGVQNCPVDSVEAMSLFAVQDIEPVDLARGLHRKGVEYMVGVFHYDPILYEQTTGYFPYLKMHFERKMSSSSGKPTVVFHFENDSSMDYEHDFQRLLKYSRSWSYRVPETDFVYRYDLIFVKDGMARFTVVRQNREYLGAATNEVAYRFVDHSGVYRIRSWTLDIDAPSDSSFTGFRPFSMDVADDLFMFIYKFGLSNDTENPDKLFTIDQLRAQARTFNETRTLNGYKFTGRITCSTTQLEQLVVAMYVIVMKDLAVENYVAAAQIGTMLDKQHSRSDKRFFSTTGKIVAYSYALPLIFTAGKVSVFFSYVAALLRSAATAGDMSVTWERVPSFVQLPSMQRYSGPSLTQDLQLTGHNFVSVDKVDVFVQPQRVRELFDDVLTSDQKKILDNKLLQPYVQDAEVDRVSDSGSEVSSALSPRKSEFDSAEPDLDWYRQDIDEYLQVKREVLWRRDEDHSILTSDELATHSVPAMREHARYNYDISVSLVGAAKDKCIEVYAGAPLGNKINMYNNAEDAGIKFLSVQDGAVQVSSSEEYAFGIDPQTMRYWPILKSGVGSYIASKTTSLLFVSRDTVLLNGFSLGKQLVALAAKSKPIVTEFALVDAIFGAGKTYEVMQRFQLGDVVVTQTRASRDDIFYDLSKDPRFRGQDLSKFIRSADSAVMHGLPRANTGYIDEGLMMFPGQIFAIARLARLSRAYVYGDTAQIPPIDRSTTLGFLTYQGMCRWNSIEFRNVTYRSPADVVLMLAQYFKLERRSLLKTASSVRRSLSLKIVSNPQDSQPYDVQPGWTFVTILRVDRAQLLQNPKMKDGKKVTKAQLDATESRLFNVGEAQGSTFPRVKICRKFCYGDQLFEQSAQAVVAFSRHMLQAEYVTTVPNDPYAKLVKSTFSYTEADLDAVQVETPEWLSERLEKLSKS